MNTTTHTGGNVVRAAAIATAAATKRRWQQMLIVLALALTAFLPALNAPVAHAAPPRLVVSENPVNIPVGRTTKDITLSWGQEIDMPTFVVVLLGSTYKSLIEQTLQPGPTGTVRLTVTIGKTYLVQLANAATREPLSAPVTITTTRTTGHLDCLPEC